MLPTARFSLRSTVSVLAGLGLGLAAWSVQAETITVSAAASLTDAFKEIAAHYSSKIHKTKCS